MELNKLLKRKERAKNEKNQQSLADACNKLGNFYMTKNRLDDALEEFREAGEIFRRASMKMDDARCSRMIGEIFLKQGKFQDALRCVRKYLKVAKEESNHVEIQRAHTTLGRCYLLIVEEASLKSNQDDITNTEDYKASEKEFLKGLLACKDLGKLVPKYELADMKARIYFNLGMLHEHKSGDEAIENYETAIKICKSNDLYEIQHTSLMALGFCYATKRNDTVAALQEYNNALEVVERLGEGKNEKMCETLLAKASLLIKNGDFQSAKQALKKAVKVKTTNEGERMSIQKQFKIVNALCKYEDELIITDSFDYGKRKELFEKIGDLASKLENYIKAIDCYNKMLEAAELKGENGKDLIPIYISLYETYNDCNDYENALKFLNKEYELIKDEPKEACTTLLRIAIVSEKAQKDFWEIERTYRKALTASRLTGDSTIEEAHILQKLILLYKSNSMTTLAETLEQEAFEKNIDLNPIEQVDSEEYSEDVAIDDIFLEVSSDAETSDDNDRTITQNKSDGTVRRKKRSMTVKKNAKGETKLHEACIAGNYQLAKMLLDQGHPCNVRDNAGWLPLHEAANHGYRDIVELLLDHGATINDRGGTKCDGISPLYDAACNGHLRVVQLLLDRGAKATIKTDANQTPLDGLRWWFENEAERGKNLSDTQKNLYNEISGRLVEQCERIGIDTNIKTFLPFSLASSGFGSMPPHMSSSTSQRKRFNASFSDDDSDKSDSENVNKLNRKGKNAGEEYKSVIKNLRNPYRERKSDECDTFEADNTKKLSAYLAEKEIDPDDWLEDDLGPVRKKQKFYTETSLKTSKERKFPETSPIKLDNVLLNSDEEEGNKIYYNRNIFDYDDDVNTLDAFDVMMVNAENGGVQNVMKKKSRRNSQTKSSQNKSQSSLFDAGFSRFIETGDVLASSSRSSSHNSSFNISSSGGGGLEKQTTTIIKVQIEDEKIIVPIYHDVTNVKISWLNEEAAKRYYSLKGIRPELKLKTADGATLLESDTLSVILCLKEENLILSEVLDWKLPSLSNRYLEACSELKCAADRDINDLLDLGRAAISLDFSNQNLRPSNVRPILKALQHQNCLSQLDLSSNFIQDEGAKYLLQLLITLRHLVYLDLSGNSITENGIDHLCNGLSKSISPTEIKCLKLNFNPIKSMNCVSELCRNKSISSLSLAACELSKCEGIEMLNTVKELDVSYNHLSYKSVREILSKLNPTTVEKVNLERCSEDANLGEILVDFIMSTCNSLRELNLSGLRLSENEILALLRSLEGYNNLKNLDLSYQKELSFISLKYILFNLDNKFLHVNLKGCKNLQNVANSFSHCSNSPIHLPNQVLLSIPQTSNDRNNYISKMKDLWNDVTSARGIAQIERNTLRLIVEYLE